MKRGRKPKPPALRVLEGNAGHRPIPDLPKLPPGVPPRPKWLSGKLAREEWDRLTEQLEAAGILRIVDGVLLGRYCEAVQEAVRASREARKDFSKQARAEKAWDHVRKFGALFGLGPAEASRVKGIGGPMPKSKLSKFIA